MNVFWLTNPIKLDFVWFSNRDAFDSLCKMSSLWRTIDILSFVLCRAEDATKCSVRNLRENCKKRAPPFLSEFTEGKCFSGNNLDLNRKRFLASCTYKQRRKTIKSLLQRSTQKSFSIKTSELKWLGGRTLFDQLDFSNFLQWRALGCKTFVCESATLNQRIDPP